MLDINWFSVGDPGEPSITDTLSENKFATKTSTLFVAGSTTIEIGKLPTSIFVSTALVEPSITEIPSSPRFAT